MQDNYNKLYVPNYNDNMCVEVLDKDTIRVFENDSSYSYTDYYVNSHYLAKTGLVDSDYIKSCTQLEKSSSFIYRNDISDILFIALLACVFTYLSCYLLFRVFRKHSR